MENNAIQIIEDTEPDWEFFNYALDLEKQWEDSLPRFTDKELFEVFPEAKRIIPLKIMEWEKELHNITSIIKNKLRTAYKQSAPENHWFWREIIKILDGDRLAEPHRHLMRLRRQLTVAQDRKPKNGAITDERIQRALAVSLVDIAMQRMKLRKNGKTFVGLCPFHNEKTPSFHIYPIKNNFYCYGCQKGGNIINFIRKLDGLSFREAIEYLT